MLGRDALFAIMHGLRSAALRTAQRLRFAIDTNGTLLDRKALEFWDSLGCVQLNVSLDGGRRATDANRRTRHGNPTWQRVVRNLRRAEDYGVDLGATAVLTRANCDAATIAAELRDLGFRSITLTPVWRSPLNPATAVVEIDSESEPEYVGSMVRLLAEYFRGLREAMDQRRPPDYFLANARAVLEAAQSPPAVQQARRCGGGALAIDCEGYLLPCAAVGHLPEFRVGHISSGVDPAAAERFCKARLSTVEVEKCRDCPVRLRCGGPCLQFVASERQLACLEPAESYCRMRKREIQIGVAALCELEREHDGTLPALLDYACDWLGAGTLPGVSAGFLRKTG
jgi:radical SAM protein with 4Fe4S-binding SPASM domain